MLKVAIVGSGLVAVKKHIPAFLKIKDKVKIVAICDLNEEMAKKVAQHFNINKAYTDFSDMLLENKPDIVDICTPPKTHIKLAIEAIEKGAHLLIEKPMAIELSDCDAIIDAAKRYQRKTCVMHNQIFNPAFTRARKLVLKGEIGAFLGIQVFLSTPTDYMTAKKEHWAHLLPGGVLGETGPHAVYLALEFLKDVREVDVRTKKVLLEYPWSNFEDFRINLVAENGIGTITLIYNSNQWAAEIDIIGTKGRLKVDLESQTVVRYNRLKLSALSLGLSMAETGIQIFSSLFLNSLRHILAKGSDAHAIGIRKFVDSILEDRPSPVSDMDGKEVVRVMKMLVDKLQR